MTITTERIVFILSALKTTVLEDATTVELLLGFTKVLAMFFERFSFKINEKSCVTWLWLVYPVDSFRFSFSFSGFIGIGL